VRYIEEAQQKQVMYLKQVVRGLYWLTFGPIIFTVLVYSLLKRWSLSYDLLPVFEVLLLGSGILAGVYTRLVRFRGPLLTHTAVIGLASPVFVYWLIWYSPATYYHNYPFTIQEVGHDYVDARWTWDDEAMGYSTVGLYRASWGFDYYVGDLNLAAHHPMDGAALKTGVELEPRFWQRVRSLTLAPDASHGQLEVVAQQPDKDTALLGEMAPPIPFQVDKSPKPLKRPLDGR